VGHKLLVAFWHADMLSPLAQSHTPIRQPSGWSDESSENPPSPIVPSPVIFDVSETLQRLRLFTQVQTYRCAALNDVEGQIQTHACSMIGEAKTEKTASRRSLRNPVRCLNQAASIAELEYHPSRTPPACRRGRRPCIPAEPRKYANGDWTIRPWRMGTRFSIRSSLEASISATMSCFFWPCPRITSPCKCRGHFSR